MPEKPASANGYPPDQVARVKYPFLQYGDGGNVSIRCAISSGKVEGMNSVVARCCHLAGQPSWQLRVHHELHAASGSIRLT
jgi:hypothetical protein